MSHGLLDSGVEGVGEAKFFRPLFRGLAKHIGVDIWRLVILLFIFSEQVASELVAIVLNVNLADEKTLDHARQRWGTIGNGHKNGERHVVPLTPDVFWILPNHPLSPSALKLASNFAEYVFIDTD